MASHEIQPGASLDRYNGLFIFVTAPHQSCCQCEQRLKLRYGGICIWFRIYPCPLLLAVCASCLSAALRAMSIGGREVSVITPKAMKSIFDDDRIITFAQIRCWGDGALLEPYPIRGK
jgi:hypothetical protein